MLLASRCRARSGVSCGAGAKAAPRGVHRLFFVGLLVRFLLLFYCQALRLKVVSGVMGYLMAEALYVGDVFGRHVKIAKRSEFSVVVCSRVCLLLAVCDMGERGKVLGVVCVQFRDDTEFPFWNPRRTEKWRKFQLDFV